MHVLISGRLLGSCTICLYRGLTVLTMASYDRMQRGAAEAVVPTAAPGQLQRPAVAPSLVAAAVAAFDRTGDVRWAVPVLAAVDHGRATALLPLAAALCSQPGGTSCIPLIFSSVFSKAWRLHDSYTSVRLVPRPVHHPPALVATEVLLRALAQREMRQLLCP